MFLISFSLLSQENRLEKGIVIDSIWIDDKLGESFSLYLPTHYKATTAYPAIFIFEPAARGKVGIQPFIKTAEQYGFILICSNDSRNGPYEVNYAIANNLFPKVFSMLSIDHKRIYTAGFSGGGRLAASIAIQSNKIAGVVSCGAGFNLKSRGLPSSQTFSYACIMGDEDMNYNELRFTESYLKKTHIPFELFTLGINHKWPSQDQILLAFDWLQLEAYKKLLIKKDSSDIKRIYNKFYLKANNEVDNDNLIRAGISFRRILKNFERYYNLDTIQTRYNKLGDSKPYKSQAKKDLELLELEEILTDELWQQFDKDLDRKKYGIAWWDNRINKLKKKQASSDKQELKMYKRLLYKIFAHAIETARYDNTIKTIEQNMFCYDICILVYPAYVLPYYKQMQNAADLGDKNKSLDYLEKLLASGYDKNEIRLDTKILKAIGDTNRFKELMNQ